MKARIKTRLLLSALMAAWLTAISTHAAIITWTNTAGGNWSLTNNWSPNQVPASSDTAVITNAGNYTVTLNVSAAVAGMVLGTSSGVTTQTFAINAQTFTLNGQATVSPNGAFNFTNGTLAGTAVLAGALNVQGGTLTASASLTVASNGVLNLGGTGTFTIDDGASLTVATNGVLNLDGTGLFAIDGPVTNSGTVNWLGGEVQVANVPGYAGVIWNQAGAQWYIQCNQTLAAYYGDEVFHNGGFLCKTNVSGTTTIATYLNDTGGTVQVQIGTIQFSGGGNLLGTYQAAAGTVINFSGGNYPWNGTADFVGPGIEEITGGTVTFTSLITTPFTASGVTLTNLNDLLGSAYLTNCSIADAETLVGTNINWANGTLTASASLTVAANGMLNLDGSGTFTIDNGASLTVATNGVLNLDGTGLFAIDGPVTNSGTVNWLGGEVQVANVPGYAGVIWNQAGAQWFIQCNQTLAAYYGDEVFHNAGLLCKTNVTGTTMVATYLNNTGGTVQAQIGTIQFSGGGNLLGTYQAAAGAVIDFSGGNYPWNGTADFVGPGTEEITGGTVTFTSPITTPFSASGATLTNLSDLLGSAYLTNCSIADAETLVGTNINWANGTLTASASLTVASNGVLNLDGSGTFTIDNGASLTVATNGVLNLGGTGTFAIDGPVTNSGTVNWLGGVIQVANNHTGDLGAIWNQTGARWYIQCSHSLTAYYGTGDEVFNNAGLLCKTNVGGTTTVATYLNDTGGTVQAQIGTIQFSGGGNLLGTYQAAAGAVIDFSGGNYPWNGTADFVGPGTEEITGGTVTFTSPITTPFSASGVTLTNLSDLLGSAYLTNCSIADAETLVGTNINWANGTLTASATLTVAANGVLNLDGSGTFTIDNGASLTVATNGVLNLDGTGLFAIDGPVTNSGTVNWLGGVIQVANNHTSDLGAIWNQTGARWYIQCSQSLTAYYGNGDEVFNNAGLLCKTNVSGTTTVDTVLSNYTGTVDAEIGTIDFNGSYTLGAGGTLSFGLNSLSSFGEITLAGTAALNGTLGAHLNNGYVPVVSGAFTILSYGAFTGGFNNTDLPPVATWQTTYGNTALTIKVTELGPAVPSLTVLSSPPNMILSWPTNASAFVLNRTASLSLPITWIPVTSGITINGTSNTITINASSGKQFYALIAP